MPEQQDWRFCQTCSVMFFAGYKDMGRCPSGRSHIPQGLCFSLPYGAQGVALMQSNWQYCEKCHALFYDGYPDKGRCPAGGGHQAQGQNGINFSLPHSKPETGSSQTQWRYCKNCHAMFYNGFSSKGICPAGGNHIADGLIFTLPHTGMKGWITTQADLRWFGVPLPMLATLAMTEFSDGLKAGAAGQIPDRWVIDLETKILADPNGFKLGYARGVLSGLLAGLKNLFTTVVDLYQLALAISPPMMAARALNEAFFLLTDPARVELRKRQIQTATKIAAATKSTIEDINQNPGNYIDLSKNMGIELGKAAGIWFKEDLLQKSTPEIGEIVGLVVGQVAFEIILAIVLELTTAGIGEIARGALAAGQGAKGGSRVARLVDRLKPLLKRTKGFQRLIRELIRDERGALIIGSRKPVPKGLLSKGHQPPWGLKMKDPFTGVEHGVTGRAGVSEASKANPGRAMRTAIDASSAEFETFKEAVFVRGEIGIQSSGHANAPGVDFVTAARRADGQMEIILNDATVNSSKKVKTVPPPKWIDEAEVAINRLDIGDTVLEEEIKDALKAKRFRIRTLRVTTSPTGITVVGW